MRRIAVWGFLLLAGVAGAQSAKPLTTQAPVGLEARTPGAAAARPPMTDKQKKLAEDTERLLKMAADLKVSVEKSNKNELSLDVVRKAEAVEQLAKSVKERVRTDR